ncbi:hypothetical protein BC831DRAFT_445497, partial [Entophlyctis helioformis]
QQPAASSQKSCQAALHKPSHSSPPCSTALQPCSARQSSVDRSYRTVCVTNSSQLLPPRGWCWSLGL